VDVAAPAALLLNVAADGTVEMSEAEVRSKLGAAHLKVAGTRPDDETSETGRRLGHCKEKSLHRTWGS
jgi:hypothetical protein